MPDQDLDELAAELAMDAKESYEQNRQEQQEFLDTVSEEEGAELLETTANIKGHTVDVSAKLNGDLMDAMGRIEARLDRFESGEGGSYEYGETADDVAGMLDSVIDDPKLHKAAFYRTYKDHGLEPLGAILAEVMDALRQEKDRRTGAADGFRKKPGGA